jgi:hypothetical protein
MASASIQFRVCSSDDHHYLHSPFLAFRPVWARLLPTMSHDKGFFGSLERKGISPLEEQALGWLETYTFV